MSELAAETETTLQDIRSERKSRARRQILGSLAGLAVLLSVLYAVLQVEDENQALSVDKEVLVKTLEKRDARISTLENAVDAQREQFLLCFNDTSYSCRRPVSPPSSELPSGPQGPMGLPGMRGQQGEKGEDGKSVAGRNGTNGTNGARGAQGERGERGAQGERGERGEQGAPGSGCPDGTSMQQTTIVTADGSTTFYACR